VRFLLLTLRASNHMDAPFDRRAFLKTAAGTRALLVSRQGLAELAFRKGRQVRFDERKREVVA